MWSIAMLSTLTWSTCHEINSTSQMLSKSVPLFHKRMLRRLPPMPRSHGDASLHNRIHGRKYQYSWPKRTGSETHKRYVWETVYKWVELQSCFVEITVQKLLMMNFNFWKAQCLIEPNSNHKPESRILVLFCVHIWQINLSSASLNY